MTVMLFSLRTRSIALVLCLLGIGPVLHAQNVGEQSVRWKSSQAVSQSDQTATTLQSTFVTKPSSIEWSQKNGQRTTTFQVSGVQGDWNDLQQAGSVTYTVQTGNVTGTLVFSKNGAGEMSVQMKLYLNGKPDLQYAFPIDSYELL
jgi:hypothetical protein